MRKPPFGEERRDRLYRAAGELAAYISVVPVRRPYWGVRPAKTKQDYTKVCGVTLEMAHKGDSVWVRYYGVGDVEIDA